MHSIQQKANKLFWCNNIFCSFAGEEKGHGNRFLRNLKFLADNVITLIVESLAIGRGNHTFSC